LQKTLCRHYEPIFGDIRTFEPKNLQRIGTASLKLFNINFFCSLFSL